MAATLALASSSAADELRGIEAVLGGLHDGALNAFVCGSQSKLSVAPNVKCVTPIGVGDVAEQWSNGRYLYALVIDFNGDTLCIAGPVSELSRNVKIAPMPSSIAGLVMLACMQKFGQVAPMPKLVLAVWY